MIILLILVLYPIQSASVTKCIFVLYNVAVLEIVCKHFGQSDQMKQLLFIYQHFGQSIRPNETIKTYLSAFLPVRPNYERIMKELFLWKNVSTLANQTKWNKWPVCQHFGQSDKMKQMTCLSAFRPIRLNERIIIFLSTFRSIRPTEINDLFVSISANQTKWKNYDLFINISANQTKWNKWPICISANQTNVRVKDSEGKKNRRLSATFRSKHYHFPLYFIHFVWCIWCALRISNTSIQRRTLSVRRKK